MTTIIKEQTIGEILSLAGDKVNKVAEILISSGMGCVGCPMAQMETLEQGCLAHGLTEEEINEILKKINEVLK